MIYKIVSASQYGNMNVCRLEEFVNEQCGFGYLPVGGIATDGKCFYQAMIRPENESRMQPAPQFDAEKVRSLLDSYAWYCHWMGANDHAFDHVKSEKHGYLRDILAILGIE